MNEHNALLVVMRHSPYGSSLARTGIDVALAAAAFDQKVNVLFMGDGVLQLLSNQNSKALGCKNLGKIIASMPLYDIETLYVESHAIEGFGISSDLLPEQAVLLDQSELQDLMHSCKHVIGF